ncbi:hypothetical protein R3P38DRAFT_3346392 [Favolaschia claudopus]|uniref:Nucleotidyl transferase AbiEii/AbiGii toxin family protein n=1 Tax=Favolaschia claudopus TaxID=2862362 RepID=A0AAW0D5T1_9AGAR
MRFATHVVQVGRFLRRSSHTYVDSSLSVLSLRLTPHLARSALRFVNALRQGGADTMLVGGAAVRLHGGPRTTKDLDFNVTKFDKRVQRFVVRAGMTIKPDEDGRPNRFKVNDPSFPESAKNATKIDLAVFPHLDVSQYTDDFEGVKVADLRLLLVKKIRCLLVRSHGADNKRQGDLHDMVYCLNRLVLEPDVPCTPLPQTLIEDVILRETRFDWKTFWDLVRLFGDEYEVAICEECFPVLGLPVLE